MSENKNKDKEKKTRMSAAVSFVLPEGTLVEMVHRAAENNTAFCIVERGAIRYQATIEVDGKHFVPYSISNNLLKNEVVLLPSEAREYESVEVLVENIQKFIHRYVDLSPLFEKIAASYVLLSWVYDAFNELPYLRVRGDAGSGKSRFLLIVGGICYKPIFASGASTVSPLFRILDSFRGTLIVDEGDFRFSDEKAELVKILNNGNGRGFPVLRSESVNSREFSPCAYQVFGPKLIATRGYFQDRALESRCLTEEMGERRLREAVPINLPATYKEESLALRNQLLMFRFRHYATCGVDPALVDRTVEPRLAQIFVPLLSVIEDEEARENLRALLREYHRELIADRGLDVEARVLEVIQELEQIDSNEISIKEISSLLEERHGDGLGRKITPHWVGYVVRKKLRLRTEKRHGSYVITPSEKAKLIRLFEKYGVSTLAGDLGDSGDFKMDAPRPEPLNS